jgi:hypothetical protein
VREPAAPSVVTAVPRLVFVFSGPGSQHLGMARPLYDGDPVFRAAIDRCGRILEGHLRRPLVSVLFGDDPAEIDRIEVTQPVVFAVGWALAEWLGSLAVRSRRRDGTQRRRIRRGLRRRRAHRRGSAAPGGAARGGDGADAGGSDGRGVRARGRVRTCAAPSSTWRPWNERRSGALGERRRPRAGRSPSSGPRASPASACPSPAPPTRR